MILKEHQVRFASNAPLCVLGRVPAQVMAVVRMDLDWGFIHVNVEERQSLGVMTRFPGAANVICSKVRTWK